MIKVSFKRLFHALGKDLGWLIDVSAYLFIIVVVNFLFNNLHFHPFPIADIAQFIDNSRDYMQWRLPGDIQAFPANPILIGLISKFITDVYPELTAAVLINVVSVSASLVVLWEMLKHRYGRGWAALGLVFVGSHPFTFANGVDADSIPLFVLLMLVSWWFWSKGNKLWVYIVTGGAYFVRFEAVLVFVALVVGDVILTKGKKLKIFTQNGVLIGGGFMVLLTALIMGNNALMHVEYGNTYLWEIADRIEDIPKWEFVTHLPEVMDVRVYSFGKLHYGLFVGFFVFLGFVMYWAVKKKDALALVAMVFSGLYLGVHMLFPAYSPRYLFPVLIAFVVISVSAAPSFNRLKNPILKVWFMVALVLFVGSMVLKNMSAIQMYLLSDWRDHKWEYRVLAEMINNSDLGKVRVISTYKGIFDYFNTNVDVEYFDPDTSGRCDSLYCIIKDFDDTSNVMVAMGTLTQLKTPYMERVHAVSMFNNEKELPCLTEVMHIDDELMELKELALYRYDFEVCRQIMEGEL